MTTLEGWHGIAFNQASESENRIHSDEVAKQYGFRGGLVPGITVYAYLVQPAVRAWGLDWLSHGGASAVFRRPLYDAGTFRVEVKPEAEGYQGEVIDAEGTVCGAGRVAAPAAPSDLPVLRGDAPAPPREQRPEGTRAALERLRERGVGAIRGEWSGTGYDVRYTRDLDDMPDIVRPDAGGYANPGWSLGLANAILVANVRIGPWIHAQSDVRYLAPIPRASRLAVEAQVADLFERSGHEFVDLDVGVFLEPDRPALHVRHRAIYRLRPPD
jgi:acyl dehydratase